MPLFTGYTACTWCMTSLSAGPLVGDTYNCTIGSLSPSTIYQYRAYVVISGTPYYGNILTGATIATPASVPTVSTGIMYSAAANGGAVCCNTGITNGGAPIGEYGILYTQLSTYACDACLRYNNVPTWVRKDPKYGSISDGTTYSGLISGMTPSTTTYYRAYAKNSVGVGYGNVCNFLTSSSPSITMLYVYGCENNGIEDSCNAGELQKPSAGKTYNATICWCMYKGAPTVPAAPTPFCVSVCRNGIEIYNVLCVCKSASSFWSTPTSGSFAPFLVDEDDTVVINVSACQYGTVEGACTKAWLASVSPNTGGYVVNYSQNCTVAYTCGTFPVHPILIE